MLKILIDCLDMFICWRPNVHAPDVIGLRVVKDMLTGMGHRGRQQATGADPSRGGGYLKIKIKIGYEKGVYEEGDASWCDG